MKKIAVIGTVGIPACYGGFESLVENLTKDSSDEVKYSVFCSKPAYKSYMAEYNNADLYYIPLKANGVQSIPYDIWSLVKSIFTKPDTVLILGVSGCIFLPIFKIFSRSKIITNIDGIEWKRDKWGWFAKKWLKLSESFAVKFSDVVVTDNKAITDYVQEEYGKSSYTIAYGGDHALDSEHSNYSNLEVSEDYYFTVCRIEPENNIEMILKSFADSKHLIKFVGNWDASEYGQNLFNTYSKYSNIELVKPIYDIKELYKLRSNCTGYIHGHSAGGTNPSLVEIMHFGKPVVAYDCSFNRYTTDDKAIYFKDSNQLTLELDRLGQDSKDLVGAFMKDIALDNYTWNKIVMSYESLY